MYLNTFNEMCEPKTTPGSRVTAEYQVPAQAYITAVWQPGLLMRKRGWAEGGKERKGTLARAKEREEEWSDREMGECLGVEILSQDIKFK